MEQKRVTDTILAIVIILGLMVLILLGLFGYDWLVARSEFNASSERGRQIIIQEMGRRQ